LAITDYLTNNNQETEHIQTLTIVNAKVALIYNNIHKQEAQLMLTAGSTRLAVSQ